MITILMDVIRAKPINNNRKIIQYINNTGVWHGKFTSHSQSVTLQKDKENKPTYADFRMRARI